MSTRKVMRCFYDVLGIERDASLDDIKSSYKKLARELHPDKNIEQPELAAEKFKELQHAYAILSDPNERAWYDSHREAILRGKEPGTEEEDEGLLNLWPYFSTSCFSGYGDDENGFYAVYSHVFETIDEEEEEEDEDEEREKAPSFGNSSTIYKEVHKFYTYWSNFVTCRQFSSKDKYNLNTAPNRQVRRLMEKENKKERDKAKKERNEQVRHLVESVKSRDKRVIARQQQLKKEEEEKKKQEETQKQEIAQKRAQQREQLMKEREAMLEQLNLQELHIIQEAEENGSENQQFYCVVCKKNFKSERQWQNHEKSKSHKQKVELLREELLLDEEKEDQPPMQQDTLDDEDEIQIEPQDDVDEVTPEEQEEEPTQPTDSSMLEEGADDQNGQANDEEDDLAFAQSMAKTAKQKKRDKKKKKKVAQSFLSDSEEEEQQNTEEQKTPLKEKPLEDPKVEEEEKKEVKQPPKLNKAKEKKKKKMAAAAATQSSPSTILKCQTCNKVFDTRNKLFAHLEETGHTKPV